MSTKFIPASDLNQQFDVLGHFYSLIVPGGNPALCRSVLEIRAKEAPPGSGADAVFVMMNPGSSKPIVEVEQMVDVDQIAAMARPLVPTKADTTQYQVMRVMHYAGWGHVRVINLSDLRDAQSKSFEQSFSQLEQRAGYTVHSIFSPRRSEELKENLYRKSDGPIVCAWGVSNKLNRLIERTRGSLTPVCDVIGLEKPGHQGKYFHPLPTLQHQKVAWVQQMLKQLELKMQPAP